MKIGIDSFCYHRQFGKAYPGQAPAESLITMEDFLRRARELGVDGVSLESCFFPSFEAGYLRELKALLDEYGMERVYAWGHPNGLEGGRNREALKEMIDSLDHAAHIGAKVMRVVGSSRRYVKEPHEPQLRNLAAMFREAIPAAEERGVVMAMENHIDFTSDEMLWLFHEVDSPHLGMNFDTGNFLRLLDDPVKGMEKLAKFVRATHIKDLKPYKSAPADQWYFFSSTPVGEGLIDIPALLRLLYEAGYQGLLAIEIDYLHPDYSGDEDAAVARSVANLRRIVQEVITQKDQPRINADEHG